MANKLINKQIIKRNRVHFDFDFFCHKKHTFYICFSMLVNDAKCECVSINLTKALNILKVVIESKMMTYQQLHETLLFLCDTIIIIIIYFYYTTQP